MVTVRNDMEDEVYNKFKEDGGKMIYKLAHDRDEDSKDMKNGGGGWWSISMVVEG